MELAGFIRTPTICDALHTNSVPTILTQKVPCMLYADDLVILSTTAEELQDSLNKLGDYCKTWGLDINADKSNVTMFSRKKNARPFVQLTCNGTHINFTKSYNYLGFNISNNVKFQSLQKTLVDKASRACI